MHKHAIKVLFSLILVNGFSALHAAPLLLVKDHKPNATIVLQAKAPAKMAKAAADLQRYIEKISGVQLPLHIDGKDVPGITLNVGNTQSARDSDLPDKRLNPETYAITRRGDDVYFAGNYATPTAFAVYSFLQDQLGVRWFAPGDEWEYVPQTSDKSTFTVDVKNHVSVPDTSPRVWAGHDWGADWNDWNLRNKTARSEKLVRRNFQNNIFRIFPPSKYAKTHPEYYPLVNGKRWIPDSDNFRLWWPCIGNPDVQRITVEYIQQWFAENPEQDSFALGMDDIEYMCSDPLCRAMDYRPDDYENHHFSSRHYKFINIIAQQIKKSNPDKYIGVLIYNIVVKPPVDVPKMEDNVFGYIADGSVAQWYQPGKKKEWMHNTQEWAKRVKHLSRYDYFGLGTFAPRVFPHSVEEMMDIDRSLGFEGSFTELFTFLPQTAPMVWAFAQKQWNLDLGMDDLLEEFYSKMYGQAAPTMKKYFDLMEESWNTQRPGHVSWVHRNIQRQAVSISAEAVHEGMQLLNTAYEQVHTPLQKKRIDVTRGALEYAGYAILEYDLARQIAMTQPSNAAQAKLAVDKIKQLGKLIKDRQIAWPEALQRQDLLGETLRVMSEKQYLETDTSVLEAPAVPGIVRTVEWYQQNESPKAAEIARQLADSFPEGNIRLAISSWNWVQQHQPQSMIVNGNFEDTSTNTATAAQADWKSKNAPPGWNLWSYLGKAIFAEAKGKTGNGFRIQSKTDSGNDVATLIQNTTLNPSSRYIGIAWVKSIDAAQAVDATISFRFRTKSGWFTGEGSTVKSGASPSTQWQPLIIASAVPEGATAMSFMLGSRNGEAIFDDAALYEIPAIQ